MTVELKGVEVGKVVKIFLGEDKCLVNDAKVIGVDKYGGNFTFQYKDLDKTYVVKLGLYQGSWYEIFEGRSVKECFENNEKVYTFLVV